MRLEKPEMSNTRASFSVSGRSQTPANQAYVDLLKAQWILHTIILREDNRASLMTDENRKLFHTLSNVSLQCSMIRLSLIIPGHSRRIQRIRTSRRTRFVLVFHSPIRASHSKSGKATFYEIYCRER